MEQNGRLLECMRIAWLADKVFQKPNGEWGDFENDFFVWMVDNEVEHDANQ